MKRRLLLPALLLAALNFALAVGFLLYLAWPPLLIALLLGWGVIDLVLFVRQVLKDRRAGGPSVAWPPGTTLWLGSVAGLIAVSLYFAAIGMETAAVTLLAAVFMIVSNSMYAFNRPSVKARLAARPSRA